MTELLSLVQALDAEEGSVTAGQAKACGADHHGETDQLCMRAGGHEEAQVLSREAHAHRVRDGSANFWFTWVNETPQ